MTDAVLVPLSSQVAPLDVDPSPLDVELDLPLPVVVLGQEQNRVARQLVRVHDLVQEKVQDLVLVLVDLDPANKT